MKKYASLIVDIKSSRSYKYADRFYIQEKLFKICELMNKIFADSIESPLTFSSGDSIQGLFKNGGACLKCVFLMKTFFSPFEIRVGVGIGPINKETLLSSKKLYSFSNSNYIEGIAYHYARQAIEESEKTKNDIIVYSNKYEDYFLNNMLIISEELKKTLSPKQKELLFLYNFFAPILNEEEQSEFDRFYDECFEVVSFDKILSNKDTILNELKESLYYLFRQNCISSISSILLDLNLAKPVFEATISSRNSDAYLAKVLNVTPQNISLVKKRGLMNRIRTEEELSVSFIERILND